MFAPQPTLSAGVLPETGPPYVCNGYQSRNRCIPVKFFNLPAIAHDRYRETLTFSLQGFSFDPRDMGLIETSVSSALKR